MKSTVKAKHRGYLPPGFLCTLRGSLTSLGGWRDGTWSSESCDVEQFEDNIAEPAAPSHQLVQGCWSCQGLNQISHIITAITGKQTTVGRLTYL